jgi:hypothetical protein
LALFSAFFRAKSVGAAEIHRELRAAIYGQDVMNEGTVRQWCRMFREGRTNVHGEERSDRPAICSELLSFFKVLTKKFVEDGASQFQNFHVNFHKFHALFFARLLQLG